jgi:hypothetical protein
MVENPDMFYDCSMFGMKMKNATKWSEMEKVGQMEETTHV